MKSILLILMMTSTLAYGDCYVGEMQCSTSCYIEEVGAVPCQGSGQEGAIQAYCNPDTGYCDADIDGVVYEGEVIYRLLKYRANRRR